MIFAIAQFLMNVTGIDFNLAMKIARYLLIALVLAAFLIVVLIGGYFSSCNQIKTQKKIDAINSNVKTAEIEANILTNTKIETNAVIANANANTQAALENVNKKRDSANYDSDYDKSVKQWCESIGYDDSACVKYK